VLRAIRILLVMVLLIAVPLVAAYVSYKQTVHETLLPITLP
jgi:hypothetical protein